MTLTFCGASFIKLQLHCDLIFPPHYTLRAQVFVHRYNTHTMSDANERSSNSNGGQSNNERNDDSQANVVAATSPPGTGTGPAKRSAAASGLGSVVKVARVDNYFGTPRPNGRKAEVLNVLIPVEAFGSRVKLHAGVAVARTFNVAYLQRIVMRDVPLPPTMRAVKLFVGHGGPELEDDMMPLTDTGLLEADPDKPLVVYPSACKSLMRRCPSRADTVAL